nr:MAG TPA: hypothetical protein [Caudoviricetes sp.]
MRIYSASSFMMLSMFMLCPPFFALLFILQNHIQRMRSVWEGELFNFRPPIFLTDISCIANGFFTKTFSVLPKHDSVDAGAKFVEHIEKFYQIHLYCLPSSHFNFGYCLYILYICSPS